MRERILRKCGSLYAVFIGGCVIVSPIVIAILLTAVITKSHIESQFRVVYSLDRRANNQEIIRLINEADKYVYFAIYYFSEKSIADALVRAKERGVAVRGINDRDASQDANKSVDTELSAAGIPVEVQKHEDGIMHIKALVTDKAYASGSYNWTTAATESNDEILEIGTDRSVHDQYLAIIKKVLAANQ